MPKGPENCYVEPSIALFKSFSLCLIVYIEELI